MAGDRLTVPAYYFPANPSPPSWPPPGLAQAVMHVLPTASSRMGGGGGGGGGDIARARERESERARERERERERESVCVRERGFLDNQEARRSRPRSAAQERFKGLLNFKKFKAGAAAVEEMCKVGGDSWQGLRGSVLPLQRCRLLFSGPHGPKLRVRVPNTRFECLAPPSSLARCFPWLCICGLGACATAVHTPSKIGDIVARLVGVAPRLLALEGTCCNLQRSLALVLLFDFLCTCLRVRALGFAFLYFSLRRWLLARVAQPQSPLRRHIVPLDLLLNNPKPLSYCYYVYVYVSLFIYMYMYMYLYMYLCMYICTCTCTCTHARARAHTHTHVHIYV